MSIVSIHGCPGIYLASGEQYFRRLETLLSS